ncbi:MAG TPA: tRNA glutamyl-Q(34) synthetase GluQRS [Tepidisphaeraceae bacterium]|nr:tRNA glutamyl-Q(34) synthetase GluQRS [Tepidisphaeraceae bacterium]
MPITRLAPSPTGALHLGNARTFLINWLLARQNNWQILLRIEDLDGPRIKKDADRQTIDDLLWLGLTCDSPAVYQSGRLAQYDAAIRQLLSAGFAYPCICTRRDVESAASAPHGEDRAAVYPGTCRKRFATIEAARQSAGRDPAIRFRVPDRVIEFTDAFAGPQCVDLSQLGDFLIKSPAPNSVPSYQLAVVVDDAQMNVTHVVRGDDLLPSAARQIALYDALNLGDRIPQYTHLPLVLGPDGRRLAKRHGDTRLATYRARGVSPNRILALMARWCGLEGGDQTTLKNLLPDFSLSRLPRHPITFTESDHAWLLARERAA